MLKLGSRLEVSSGEGSFSVYFIEWIGKSNKMNVMNKFGGLIVVDQADVLNVFI